ncbi:MAG: hypothetical protein Q4D06_09210 [Coriobacteriia bacterium]|nr:hypothetical protein [Coriobacteriia bacterium]
MGYTHVTRNVAGACAAGVLCLAASAALAVGAPTEALAKDFTVDFGAKVPQHTLKLGEVGELTNLKLSGSSSDDFAYFKAEGDTDAVKVVTYNRSDGYKQGFSFVGVKPGTVLLELGIAEPAGLDDEGAELLADGTADGCVGRPDKDQVRYLYLTVGKQGVIEAAQCDGLFKGVNMAASTLYNDYDFREMRFGDPYFGVYKPFLAASGTTFKSGTNATASSTGKYVKFPKSGAAAMSMVRDGKAYKVSVAKVHSKAATRAALEKKLKAKYKTYRYVKGSAKLYKSKALNNRYALKMQYKVKSGGKYVTRNASAWFSNGAFKCYYTKLV